MQCTGMKRATYITLVAALLAPSGCVKRALVTPAEDHYVQTQVVADSCKADGFGQGRCTEDDLQAMVDQACLIDAILKGKGAESCSVTVDDEEAGADQ